MPVGFLENSCSQIKQIHYTPLFQAYLARSSCGAGLTYRAPYLLKGQTGLINNTLFMNISH